MKKVRLLALLALTAGTSTALVGCGDTLKPDPDFNASKVKVGLICLHGDYSTYDNNFIVAMNAAKEKLGFELSIAQDIAEGQACYDKASEMAELGCNIIFADSFGHEPYMIDAAKAYPNVLFCHATGTNGAKTNRNNFGDAFASIYEGRYLAGVAGGLKLKAMYADASGNVSDENAKVGYVGAYTYAEIISGFTSFYLGVKSVVPNATMQVKYSGSWYDETVEKSIAQELIGNGCKLISQHADSHGAPQACEEANPKVPNVSYNGSTLSDGPNTYLISSRINWQPYYEHVINNYVEARKEGKKINVENDFTGTLADGSVEIDAASANCADGTQATLDAVKAELIAGTRHVFDLSKFTVGGQAPSAENMKPVDATWGNMPSNIDLLKDGYYHESEFRSAPSFDVIIDGITNLNVNYGD